MLKLSEKQKARREKFRKLGAAISKLGDPNVSDYYSGKESSFQFKRFDAYNRDASDPLNTEQIERVEVPLGPRFNTPQWERTTR